MSSFSIKLRSTEKSYTVLFKKISLFLSFVKPFYTLSEQKLYELRYPSP